jgi:hypothetical protein
MRTIKAFNKDGKGYYCDPMGAKFYYEEGKTYRLAGEVRMFRRGFHASANFDISDTLDHYNISEITHYGIVELNVIDKNMKEAVGNEITVLEFLPNYFGTLSEYDKTGRWIYLSGNYMKNIDFHKAMEKLSEVDKSGEWIYHAGCDWKIFDFEKGLDKLMEVDKTGRWIYNAGMYWKIFDFEKGLDKLMEVDKTGEMIYYAGIYWNINHAKK